MKEEIDLEQFVKLYEKIFIITSKNNHVIKNTDDLSRLIKLQYLCEKVLFSINESCSETFDSEAEKCLILEKSKQMAENSLFLVKAKIKYTKENMESLGKTKPTDITPVPGITKGKDAKYKAPIYLAACRIIGKFIGDGPADPDYKAWRVYIIEKFKVDFSHTTLKSINTKANEIQSFNDNNDEKQQEVIDLLNSIKLSDISKRRTKEINDYIIKEALKSNKR